MYCIGFNIGLVAFKTLTWAENGMIFSIFVLTIVFPSIQLMCNIYMAFIACQNKSAPYKFKSNQVLPSPYNCVKEVARYIPNNSLMKYMMVVVLLYSAFALHLDC